MANTDKKAERHNLNMELQKHHLARLSMMMAEECGENLTYEQALNN